MKVEHKALLYVPHDNPQSATPVVVVEQVGDHWFKVAMSGEFITVHESELHRDYVPEEHVEESLLLLDISSMAGLQLSRDGFIKMIIDGSPRVFDIRSVFDLTLGRDDEYPDYWQVKMSCSGHSNWVRSKSQKTMVAVYGTLIQARDYFTGFSKTLL